METGNVREVCSRSGFIYVMLHAARQRRRLATLLLPSCLLVLWIAVDKRFLLCFGSFLVSLSACTFLLFAGGRDFRASPWSYLGNFWSMLFGQNWRWRRRRGRRFHQPINLRSFAFRWRTRFLGCLCCLLFDRTGAGARGVDPASFPSAAWRPRHKLSGTRSPPCVTFAMSMVADQQERMRRRAATP